VSRLLAASLERLRASFTEDSAGEVGQPQSRP
jgi:hypothetical protein